MILGSIIGGHSSNPLLAAGLAVEAEKTKTLTKEIVVHSTSVCIGQMIINVSGQGTLPGGATEWSLAVASGPAGCTYPDRANRYVTPVANCPLAARLKAAGIT